MKILTKTVYKNLDNELVSMLLNDEPNDPIQEF